MCCRLSRRLDPAIELAFGLLLCASCATQQGEFVPLGLDHPAHPQAEPGWFVDVGATLTAMEGASARSEFESGAGAEHEANGVQQRVYACPMHPEVRSSEPGTCSICGMQLEEVKPKASTSEGRHEH